jgi:outer membrane protein TolC
MMRAMHATIGAGSQERTTVSRRTHLQCGAGLACAVVFLPLTLATPTGCQADKTELDEPLTAYRDRMLVEHEQEVEARRAAAERGGYERVQRDRALVQLAGSQSEETKRASLLTEPGVEEPPSPTDVLRQIPDPIDADTVFDERLAALEAAFPPIEDKRTGEKRDHRVVASYKRVIPKAREYLRRDFHRDQRVELSLVECVRRALANNYVIRLEAYTPAISQTQLVEAEAAFDAAFFLDFTYSNLDRMTTSGLMGAQSDTRTYGGGFRKLLPTGMSAEVKLEQSRQYQELTQITSQFTTLNPAYDTAFTATLTQPLLRGFGLDYNRAGINIARADLKISRETFLQQVRDTLLQVEQAYWQLASARRSVMVLAETVAQNWATFQSIEERQVLDATPVELNNSRARWQSREVEFLEAVKLVRDAEDRLKNLMNDPEFKLSGELEIIPAETPLVAPMAVDHFAELRTALDERSEIRQARLAIEKARIQTQRTKNETLPQLDLAFQYDVQGIGPTADTSFDKVTTNRYRSYTLSVNFSYPFGNRAARAAHRRACLQEHQAVVQCRRWFDIIAEELNGAVRQLMVRYKQIAPQFEAVVAADRNLRALQARTETISPTYLETELSAVEQVASTRQALLQKIAEYNIAVVELEKAKGTLLEYNNVIVTDEPVGG